MIISPIAFMADLGAKLKELEPFLADLPLKFQEWSHFLERMISHTGETKGAALEILRLMGGQNEQLDRLESYLKKIDATLHPGDLTEELHLIGREFAKDDPRIITITHKEFING